MYIFAWKVTDTEIEKPIRGLTVADDLSHAIRKVVDYVGEDHEEFSLSLIAEDTLEVDAQVIIGIKECMVW